MPGGLLGKKMVCDQPARHAFHVRMPEVQQRQVIQQSETFLCSPRIAILLLLGNIFS